MKIQQVYPRFTKLDSMFTAHHKRLLTQETGVQETMEQLAFMERPAEQTPAPTPPKAKKEAPNHTLTPRDTKALTFIAEMYTMRFDMLQKMLGADAGKGSKEQKQSGVLSASTTSNLVSKWRTMGLVESRRIVGDEPPYIWLTVKGLRSVGFDYRETAPSLATVKHYHIVNIVRLYLEAKNPGWRWKSEREMRGEVEALNAAERRGKHTPDGILIAPTAHEYAVEIELTRKATDRLKTIVRRLAADYTGAFYYTTSITHPHVVEITRTYSPKKENGELDPSRNPFVVKELSQVYQEVQLYG